MSRNAMVKFTRDVLALCVVMRRILKWEFVSTQFSLPLTTPKAVLLLLQFECDPHHFVIRRVFQVKVFVLHHIEHIQHFLIRVNVIDARVEATRVNVRFADIFKSATTS